MQVVFQACMAGIVFAKFTKPTSRAETLMFSKQVSLLMLYPSLTGFEMSCQLLIKQALITMRNGSFFLLCRIGDLR